MTDMETDTSGMEAGKERLINSDLFTSGKPEWKRHEINICPVNDPVTWQDRDRERWGQYF